MPEYKIYLVDYTASKDFSSSKKSLLANRLKNLFDSVIAGQKDYSIKVLWEFPTAMQPTELVCYYVLNRNKSIIKAKYSHAPGTDGFTRFKEGDGSISEVYYTNWAKFPTFLADLTFHEFMHNKFEGGNTGIAVHDDTTGFGSSRMMNNLTNIDDDDPATPDDERLKHDYSLTSDNVTNMFAAMGKEVKQVLVSQSDYNLLMKPVTSKNKK